MAYLFQRGPVWWIKLQSPGKRTERSLGTRDELEAKIIASPLIAAHHAALLAARPRFETVWLHAYEPGREHPAPDGLGKIVATDREAIFIGHNGAILRTEPNGGPGNRLVGTGPLTPRALATAFIERFGGDDRPKLAIKDGDDKIFDTYLSHKNISGYARTEAEATWATFKSVIGKPLKATTRDDGRMLAAHFKEQGDKSATVKKKIGRLCAAVNMAISDSRPIDPSKPEGAKWIFNPFSGVVKNVEDQLIRVPFDASDLKLIKSGFDTLSKSDQLLIRLLAATGMRLSEAMAIKSEEPRERGIRFVKVGHKTEASKRRVPLPADVLSYLPNPIKGPLFEGSPATTSKRLCRYIRDMKILDERKVIHSFRHRAKDRLRAVGCPLDVQYELLGHETKTEAAGYGHGSPVPLLRKWLDKVGF